MSDEVEYQDGCIRNLDTQDLIDINRWMIQSFTPREPIGVLNPENLEMAQQKPTVVKYVCQTTDMALLAAELMHAIARLHAFHNANKRTAIASAIIFLRMNGYQCTPPVAEGLNICEGIVLGHYETAEVADWLASHSSASDSAGLAHDTMFMILGEHFDEQD
jgi:death-on-curing protein